MRSASFDFSFRTRHLIHSQPSPVSGSSPPPPVEAPEAPLWALFSLFYFSLIFESTNFGSLTKVTESRQYNNTIMGMDEKITAQGDSKSSARPATRLFNGASPSCSSDEHVVGEVRKFGKDIEEQKAAEGHAAFHRLGWKRLTVVLIVEAIALGSLSLPGAFAKLGMVAGTICSVGIGLLAIYTSYVVGQTKLKHPEVEHYADAGRLMFGRIGYEVVGVMFVLQLIFIVGSHVLTGTIMWTTLTDGGAGVCALVYGVVSAILLFLLALPPSFAEMAILGYIDFVSIFAAIGITIIATGLKATNSDGGLAAVDWSAWPQPDLTLAEAFIAVTNICFAYSFAMVQFSFMDEMHTPADFSKSIVALGGIEIVLYTLTGALIYAFVGQEVQSPALLSASPLISKIAFGIALPVIFISGSINTTVASKYIITRFWPNSVIKYVNTFKGWVVWIILDVIITIIAWIIAEAIPYFQDLLAISSALFISGFTFYLPALMWFLVVREGPWLSKKNIGLGLLNGACFVIGLLILGLGTYSAAWDIDHRQGAGRSPFSCAAHT